MRSRRKSSKRRKSSSKTATVDDVLPRGECPDIPDENMRAYLLLSSNYRIPLISMIDINTGHLTKTSSFCDKARVYFQNKKEALLLKNRITNLLSIGWNINSYLMHFFAFWTSISAMWFLRNGKTYSPNIDLEVKEPISQEDWLKKFYKQITTVNVEGNIDDFNNLKYFSAAFRNSVVFFLIMLITSVGNEAVYQYMYHKSSVDYAVGTLIEPSLSKIKNKSLREFLALKRGLNTPFPQFALEILEVNGQIPAIALIMKLGLPRVDAKGHVNVDQVIRALNVYAPSL